MGTTVIQTQTKPLLSEAETSENRISTVAELIILVASNMLVLVPGFFGSSLSNAATLSEDFGLSCSASFKECESDFPVVLLSKNVPPLKEVEEVKTPLVSCVCV